jgi:hypothetical protein
LGKFLKKANEDIEAAAVLLRETIVWREVMKVEKILEQDREKRSPLVSIHKTDLKGQPIM